MTSQCHAIRSQSRKIVKFVKIMVQTFLKCERTCDLSDVPATMYDRKTTARPFDTIHGILRSLSLTRSRLKGWNAPICRIRNWGVKSRMFKNLNSDADPGFQPTWKTVKEYLTAVPSLLYQWNSLIINSVIKLHQFLMDVRSYPENIQVCLSAELSQF